MTKNLDSNGLHSIADTYDLFYIDLWGVIHNGINLHEQAIVVLCELLKKNNVNVVKDHPGVGMNLTDHLMLRPVYKVKNLESLNISNSASIVFFHINKAKKNVD